jgi:hypothetical protein
MIKGISLSETIDFTSKYDKSDPKTIWKLGAINSDVYAYLGQKANTNSLEAMTEAVRYGLRGFENLTDEHDNPVKFSTISRPLGECNYNVVSGHILRIIPIEVITELGAEILNLTKIDRTEAKNS